MVGIASGIRDRTRYTSTMRAVLILLVTCVACGASQNEGVADAARDTTTTADAFGADVELPGADASDSAVDPPDVDPVPLGDAGGYFLCVGCVCDGPTHYCDKSGGGPPSPKAPWSGDASAFGDAGLCAVNSRCKPFPKGCDLQPSCECLLSHGPQNVPCSCRLDDSGAGLVYACNYP